MKKYIGLFVLILLAGCCDAIPILPWCPCTPTPEGYKTVTPTPIPTATPEGFMTPTASPPPATGSPTPVVIKTTPTPAPEPFGKVVLILPCSVPNVYGSIDFQDDFVAEFCQGTQKIFLRMHDGSPVAEIPIDSKLTDVWGIAWDPIKECWFATNPECVGYDWNVVQLDKNGRVIGGYKMMGGHSSNWIRNYDPNTNTDLVWPAVVGPDDYQIKVGDLEVVSKHFSLVKGEWDNVNDPKKYWEAWWFKQLDMQTRAGTRTGMTIWFADWEGDTIWEYPMTERKGVAIRTGRYIRVPGVTFSSLKFDGQYMWGKSKSGIYKISLGMTPPTKPSPTPTGDVPFSVTLSDSTVQSAAVDSYGNIYATGSTGAGLVYAMKLSRSGEKLGYRTISTGNGQGIAVDREGNIYLGGGVNDDNWPVTPGCFQAKRPGKTPNAYLCKLSPDMKTLIWSTYIGGGLQHAPDAPDGSSIKNLRTDDAGNVYFIASSQDNDFPLGTNGKCIIGYRPPCAGCYTVYDREHVWGYSGPGQPSKWSNVILGKFDGKTGLPVRMTNPGGSGPDTTSGAFAVSNVGDVYYGARTKSTQENTDPWPSTSGSFRDLPYDGGQAWFDGAAGRLNLTGDNLVWASFLGGHAQNNPFGGAVKDERFAVVGYTKASDFPIKNAIQSKFGGDHDWFVSRFTWDGGDLEWSTFLGGGGYDVASQVAIDQLGRTWVCGLGGSGFPTTDGTKPNGTSIVARISADGRTLEYSTARHGGQDATDIVLVPGFYVTTITDGDNGRVVKEKF